MPAPAGEPADRDPAPALADQGWRLASSVELRPEPFGALAYDFHTRQLSFLKTTTLVDVVRRLEGSPTVSVALVDAGVPEAERAAYLVALGRLADTGLIQPQQQEDHSA